MRLALFGRTPRQGDLIYVQKLIDEISNKYGGLFIHRSFYNKIKENIRLPDNIELFETKEELQGRDFLISMGGDGTFLDTLSIVMDSNIPIIGINIGHLGFLTSVGRDGIDKALEDLEKGNYTLEELSLIRIETGIRDTIYGLNDVYVKSSHAGGLLDIDTSVDDKYIATYVADGVILTTPTGSTAYNMSAGGPIISPKSSCMCITPICPHNLTLRPLIIPDKSKVCLKVTEPNREVSLHIDSYSFEAKTPIEIEISKADFRIKLVRIGGESFYTAIRNKLMWGTNIRRKK